MQYTNFRDEIQLSRLGMSTKQLPIKNNENGTAIDYTKFQSIIDYVVSHGVNYFENLYISQNNESELFLLKALSKYPRENYFLAEKYNTNPNYAEYFQNQLKRLNTDYIDFYIIDDIQDSTIEKIIDSRCIQYFEKQKTMGKIRYLGFSFRGSLKTLWRIQEIFEWDFVQMQLNHFEWNYCDADILYDALMIESTPIIIAESENRDSQEMRWLMDLPQVAVILSTVSDILQFEENANIFNDCSFISCG